MISDIRKVLRGFAMEYDATLAEVLDVEVTEISSRTERSTHGYFSALRDIHKYKSRYLNEEVPPGLRRKRKYRPKLDRQQKLAIAHRVIVDGEKQEEVGRDFRASKQVVSEIVSKVTKNHQHF